MMMRKMICYTHARQDTILFFPIGMNPMMKEHEKGWMTIVVVQPVITFVFLCLTTGDLTSG